MIPSPSSYPSSKVLSRWEIWDKQVCVISFLFHSVKNCNIFMSICWGITEIYCDRISSESHIQTESTVAKRQSFFAVCLVLYCPTLMLRQKHKPPLSCIINSSSHLMPEMFSPISHFVLYGVYTFNSTCPLLIACSLLLYSSADWATIMLFLLYFLTLTFSS